MSVRLSSAERGSDRLADRRRHKRRRILVASGILSVVFLGVLVYGLWQQPVRISHIVMYGTDQSLAAVAQASLVGGYLGAIPYDSTFFLSESRIRDAILTAHPDIAAVSIFRNGLTGLSIRVDARVPIARWCGASFDGAKSASSTPSVASDCYFFDADGLLYATSSEESMGASQAAEPVNPFVVYAPLAGADAGQPYVNKVLPNADKFPSTFDFARQLTQFGSPVAAIVFRGDEVDQYLKSGSHVTYVLGDEQNAFTALTSARANFNLANGSTEYVDLRFPGKVYVKPRK